MATSRVLRVSFAKFDDADDFDFGLSFLRNNAKLKSAIDTNFTHFTQAMGHDGFTEFSPMVHHKRRLEHAYRRSVERLCFHDRFKPVAAWLEDNGVSRADPHGKFYGTRSYRIKNMDVRVGFTITFGTVGDAIHFKLRWM